MYQSSFKSLHEDEHGQSSKTGWPLTPGKKKRRETYLCINRIRESTQGFKWITDRLKKCYFIPTIVTAESDNGRGGGGEERKKAEREREKTVFKKGDDDKKKKWQSLYANEGDCKW